MATGIGAYASDHFTHDSSVLPQAAKDIIRNNFKAQVSVIKIDKDFGRVSEYDVVLTDGSEIQFDSKGNWRDVEAARGKVVPDGFVPKAIRSYVADNQRGAGIVSISREGKDYEVELSNGVDMKFGKDGIFKRYD